MRDVRNQPTPVSSGTTEARLPCRPYAPTTDRVQIDILSGDGEVTEGPVDGFQDPTTGDHNG